MKPKRGSGLPALICIAAIPLLSSGAFSQTLYWAAPINESGNRDGIWSAGAVSWASAAGGAAMTAWTGGRAVFSNTENGTVTLAGNVYATGLSAGMGGSYTVAGSGMLLLTGPITPPSLHVDSGGSGVLTINVNISSSNAFRLNKTGAGTLNVNGWIMTPTLSLLEGTTVLSKSSFTGNLENSSNLMLNGDNSVFSYQQTSGVLGGSAKLTVSGTANLQGGTIAGGLSAKNINSSGLVNATGFIGGAMLTVSGGTFTMAGSSGLQTIKIASGGTFVDSSGGLSGSLPVVENQGIFRLEKDVSITKLVQSGGDLTGPGILSAQSAIFSGGVITGSVSGDISISGNVTASGNLSGNSLKVQSGKLLLQGSLSSQSVEINMGQLQSVNGGLGAGVNINNKGTLVIDSDETIHNYSQSGFLTGKGTLKVTGGPAIVSGGNLGNLDGDLLITGNALLLGQCKGANLTVSAGSLTIHGSASHGNVAVSLGATLDTSGGLSDHASVENSGWFRTKARETVKSYIQTETGTLAADATLAVTDAALLQGGRVFSGILSCDDIQVSGSVQGWQASRLEGENLTIISTGNLNMPGVIACRNVTIERSGKLVTSGVDASADAVVTNSGAWTVGADTAVSRYIQKSGSVITNNGSILTAADGLILDGGSLVGRVQGAIRSNGYVSLFAQADGDELRVESGTLSVYGQVSHHGIHISDGATLMNQGDLGDGSFLVNEGVLSMEADDTIDSLTCRGGTVNGIGRLVVSGPVIFEDGELAGVIEAKSGAELLDGTIVSGALYGSARTTGNVTISGKAGGSLHIEGGLLTLTGIVESLAPIKLGSSLVGNGRINGDLINKGTLATLSDGDRCLEIDGDFSNKGLVSMSLTDAGAHDQIKVGGIASLGGDLIVTNRGTGLAAGEIARLIDAAGFRGEFEGFQALGFGNGVLYDDATGRLIGMAGGRQGSADRYLNLNESQTDAYFSLYEDSVEIGVQNVSLSGSSASRSGVRDAMATGSGDSVVFTSGLSNGDAMLVEALNQATFTDPGAIYQPVINGLSPEAHRGMADYTEQSLRNHARQGMDAAPVAVSGRTRVFAVTHTATDGVESGQTDAGYDLQFSGITAGLRYDLDPRTQIGGWFGGDVGDIKGSLIDTDARGLALGVFGQYLAHKETQTTLTAGLSCGTYDFDAKRHAFLGDVGSDDVGSDGVEIMLGARSAVYQNFGLRVMPTAALRYLGGSVEGFTESGSGVALEVGGQDIESWMLEVGVDAEYKPRERVTLFGNLGFVTDFGDSEDSINASFAASGALARPFTVFAPGIDEDGVALGLGVSYDFSETMRANLGYRGDFRFDAENAHAFSVGLSLGF